MSEVEPRDAVRKSGPAVFFVKRVLDKRRITMVDNTAKRESTALKDGVVSPKLAEAYVRPAIIECFVTESRN
jgi:hypothetical protein